MTLIVPSLSVAPLLFALTLSQLLTTGLNSKIDEEPEIATEQIRQEAVLEVRYARLKERYGVRDRRTLEVFFELFDLWIMLYRLNKADTALQEILPACEWRRDDFSTKAIQALAFTRWKQGRYREALSSFHMMEGWMGKNHALSENIGHTYNTIGAYDEAEKSFKDALKLTKELPNGTASNVGGVLLGLAGVQDRRGAHQDALPTATSAYDYYKAKDKELGWETSLTAKAGNQLSKIHMKLGNLEKAEELATEALRLFEETSGDDSPLVAGALERLGSIYTLQERRPEAQQAFHRAYKVEGIKDAFDLVEVMEIHNKLMDSHLTAGGLDRQAFRRYFGVVEQVTKRVREEMKQDGNAGAYYKLAGELYVLGSDCGMGRPLLLEAYQLFKYETSVDTTGLMKACSDLVAFCDGTYAVPDSPPAVGSGADEL